jgi:hypothetical protein
VLLGTPLGNTLGTSWGTHIEHGNIIGSMMGTQELLKFILPPLVLLSDLIFKVFSTLSPCQEGRDMITWIASSSEQLLKKWVPSESKKSWK